MIKAFFIRTLLPKLIARACESRIPRSGKRGEAVNCYVVALDEGDSPHFVATGVSGDQITGLLWDGDAYGPEHQIPISDIGRWNLRITHYYGLSDITFDSIYDLAWHYFTRTIYLKIHLYRYLDATHQYRFNKRKLVTKRRMDLLKFMMDDQLDRDHDGVDIISLMVKLYSLRLFLHPSWEVQQQKVKLYLDSLVDSGELEIVNNEYVVTGKAIGTIERYEEEERRHTEAVKLQTRMLWLALIAAILALVQIGVIVLPS